MVKVSDIKNLVTLDVVSDYSRKDVIKLLGPAYSYPGDGLAGKIDSFVQGIDGRRVCGRSILDFYRSIGWKCVSASAYDPSTRSDIRDALDADSSQGIKVFSGKVSYLVCSPALSKSFKQLKDFPEYKNIFSKVKDRLDSNKLSDLRVSGDFDSNEFVDGSDPNEGTFVSIRDIASPKDYEKLVVPFLGIYKRRFNGGFMPTDHVIAYDANGLWFNRDFYDVVFRSRGIQDFSSSPEPGKHFSMDELLAEPRHIPVKSLMTSGEEVELSNKFLSVSKALSVYEARFGLSVPSMKKLFPVLEESGCKSFKTDRGVFSARKFYDLLAEEVLPLENLAKAYRDEFLVRNERLVFKLAHSYLSRKTYHKNSLDFMDISQEGNIGLMRAVSKFDPKMGVRFYTHAFYWVKQSMDHALMEGGLQISIPVYLLGICNKVEASRLDFFNKKGRFPTEAELKKITSLDLGTIREAMRASSINNMLHLNHPLETGNDSNTPLESILVHESSQDVEGLAISYHDCKKLRAFVENLVSEFPDDKHKLVFESRFPREKEGKTLGEVGESFGCSREWIRQIEAGMLRKIRNSPKFKANFSNYFGGSSE